MTCGVILFIVFIVLVVAGVAGNLKMAEKKPVDEGLKKDLSTALEAGNVADVKIAVGSLCYRIRQPDYSGNKKVDANSAYQKVLGALNRHPDLKPQALELGRLAYGIGRPKDTPTIYDESAIANDIAAYS